MFEKVNPSHPDKLADRIAGAVVDYCYTQEVNPKVAVEVLLGHRYCNVIVEASVKVTKDVVAPIVNRIAGPGIITQVLYSPQDSHLANNQAKEIRCGDNGIFRGMPLTGEQMKLSYIAHQIYDDIPFDGKYIIAGDKLIICQSNAEEDQLQVYAKDYNAVINPLGPWTGGPDVDTGATNRKLGSDMGDAVTGGGLHGKDLSKADVSVNIFAHLEAQRLKQPVEFFCAIGDKEVNGVPYAVIVETARAFIREAGGFEKFAEWGLI